MTNWTPTLDYSGKPLYLAIADTIAKDIEQGVILPGDRLPPQRKLAEQLGIDFTTVSRAYTEAQKRGLVDSQVGRGTFVLGEMETHTIPDDARAAEEDLTMNMPPEPTDAALLVKMQNGLNYVSANLIPLLRYQSAIGGDKDKIAASTWLSLRGMVPKLERIAVTPGAHATIMAILSQLTKPGDTVLCEQITYPGIRAIASRLHIKLRGVVIDHQGIVPDALEDSIRKFRPKAIFLNPTLQNPTTVTMPTERRLEISKVLRVYGLPLVEDDAYGFIPSKAPAPFAVSIPELTWHIGGLAKCIGAGLRLAYTVVPTVKDAYALEEALRTIAVMPSPLSMGLVTQWIEDGTADAIRRFIRVETAARQEIASEILHGFEYRSAENAFNIWLRLPEGMGSSNIITRMNGKHIGIVPSDVFTVGDAPDDHVRVCLGGKISREALSSGLYFMSHVLSQSHF